MTAVPAVSYGLNLVPPFAIYSLALAFTNKHIHKLRDTLAVQSLFLRYFLYCAWISAHMGFVNEVKLTPQPLPLPLKEFIVGYAANERMKRLIRSSEGQQQNR